MYGLMSIIGVPSIISTPLTISLGPSGEVNSIDSNLTQESPMGLGLKGERVANTPIRTLPPSLGGRTVGVHPEISESDPLRIAFENFHNSQMCENPSNPRKASALAYSFSKVITPERDSIKPL